MPHRRAFAWLSTSLLAATVSACADNPAGPQIGPPSIVCSLEVTATSPTGAPVAVHYDPPLVLGEAPVTATCSPASNSLFSAGTTTVSCTAKDSRNRSASCTFPVTVTVPRLSATRYLAHGDSITAGEFDTTQGPNGTTCQAPTFGFGPQIYDPGRAYPARLLRLLGANYPSQAFTVFNAGESGRPAEKGAADFPGELAAQNPQIALIQEGANNFLGTTVRVDTATRVVVDALRSMVRTAAARGVTPFVGNQLPKRAGACRGENADAIPGVNQQIKAMVEAEGFGAYFVDLYAAFGGVASAALISADGLHPTEAGNDLIAQTFLDAIRARLQQSTTTITRVSPVSSWNPASAGF